MPFCCIFKRLHFISEKSGCTWGDVHLGDRVPLIKEGAPWALMWITAHFSLLLWLMLATCGRNTPELGVGWCHLRLILATKYECWGGWGLGVRGSHSGDENIWVKESMASHMQFERRTCLLIWGLRFPVCKTGRWSPVSGRCLPALTFFILFSWEWHSKPQSHKGCANE